MARRSQLRLLTILTGLWLAWVGWFLVTGRADATVRVVDDEGAAVAGAVVSHEGRELGRTDADGRVEVRWSRSMDVLDVVAPGYLPGWVAVDDRPSDDVVARLDTRLLRGVVADPEGTPLDGVQVASGYGQSVTGRDGEFVVRNAEPGVVSVWRPAWERGDFEWDGSPGATTIEIEPLMVKAVHVSGDAASDPVRWGELLALTQRTELNAIMLDLKDEAGYVYYDTRVETARRVGAVRPGYDLAEVARQVGDRGLYLIGRIVTFQDPLAANTIPEMAITDRTTGGPFAKGEQYFLDPTDPDARAYALALAEEACRLGVDEVQFDYVRYPDGFGESAVFDGGSDQDSRVRTIRSFLVEAREVLHPQRCAVAGDIFGFITGAADDGGIGQQWEVVSEVLDVVSPMLYPSHYDSGWYGFEEPEDHPGEMVRRALEDGLARLEGDVVVRPWLQDYGYSAAQVREEIEASEAFGLGWMLWNAASEVSVGALRPASS